MMHVFSYVLPISRMPVLVTEHTALLLKMLHVSSYVYIAYLLYACISNGAHCSNTVNAAYVLVCMYCLTFVCLYPVLCRASGKSNGATANAKSS